MTANRTHAQLVQAAAGTQFSLATVMAVLNAAEAVEANSRGGSVTALTGPDGPDGPDGLVEQIPCDECGDLTPDPETCLHGREQCPPCRSTLGLGCKACVREALADAS